MGADSTTMAANLNLTAKLCEIELATGRCRNLTSVMACLLSPAQIRAIPSASSGHYMASFERSKEESAARGGT